MEHVFFSLRLVCGNRTTRLLIDICVNMKVLFIGVVHHTYIYIYAHCCCVVSEVIRTMQYLMQHMHRYMSGVLL